MTTPNTTFTKVIDVDFDLSHFNKTQRIKGTAIINVPYAMQSTAGSAICDVYCIVKVRHGDGTTETVLGSAQTEPLTSHATPGGIESSVANVKIVLTNKTFKKGDVLRLTIEGWGKRTSGDLSQQMIIAHDPQNRDGTHVMPSTDTNDPTTTKLMAFIPFEIL